MVQAIYFTADTVENDIALLELPYDVTREANADMGLAAVRPVCLPAPTTRIHKDLAVRVTGWGKTSKGEKLVSIFSLKNFYSKIH